MMHPILVLFITMYCNNILFKTYVLFNGIDTIITYRIVTKLKNQV